MTLSIILNHFLQVKTIMVFGAERRGGPLSTTSHVASSRVEAYFYLGGWLFTEAEGKGEGFVTS